MRYGSAARYYVYLVGRQNVHCGWVGLASACGLQRPRRNRLGHGGAANTRRHHRDVVPMHGMHTNRACNNRLCMVSHVQDGREHH